MTTYTDNLNITEVATNQVNQELTVNTALNALDDAGNRTMPITFVSNALTLTVPQFTRNLRFAGGNQTADAVLELPTPLTHRNFVVYNSNTAYSIAVGGTSGATVDVAPLTNVSLFCDGTDVIAETGNISTGVDSVLGNTGTVTLAEMVIGGLAPIAAPTLTGSIDLSGGTVIVPTLTITTNNTLAASTAFVHNYVSSLATGVSSVVGDTGAVTLSLLVAGGVAPLASPLFTGTVDVTTGVIRVASPSNPADAATKAYVDGFAQGVQIKPTATVATTAALPAGTYSNGTAGVGATFSVTATGTLTIDGHLTALGDVILVMNQVAAAEDGLYTVTTAGATGVSAVLTRSVDMDMASQFSGALVPVSNIGPINANTLWLANPSGAVTVGTTSIPFTQINAATQLTGTNGMIISGGSAVADFTLVAPLAAPSFTGTATVAALHATGSIDLTGASVVRVADPPTSLDSSTRAANTEWVAAFLAASGYAPIGSGAVASVVGASGTVTLANLVAGGVAPIAGPTLTGSIDLSGGTVIVPTLTITSNTTLAASTAFVYSYAAPLAGPTFTGTVTLPAVVSSGGTVDLTGAAEVKVPTPANAADAATKAYVDATAQGLQIKPTATVATTAALPAGTYSNGTAGVGATFTVTATGTLTVDTRVTALGDVVLVTQQASAFQNGLYTVTTAGGVGVAAVLTRHVDMDTAAQFSGAFIPVSNAGSAYANTLWIANPSGAVTVGTTSIPFTQVNAIGELSGAGPIQVSGTTVSVVSINSGYVIGNGTTAAAAGSAVALSSVIDQAVGSVQGDIAYRNGSVWAVLPPGTSGQILQTGGTSANPSWATAGFNVGTVVSALGPMLAINSGTLSFGLPVTLAGTASGTLSITGDSVVNLASAGGAQTLAAAPTYSRQWAEIDIKQGATASTLVLNAGFIYAASGGPTSFTITGTANQIDRLRLFSPDQTHWVVMAVLQGMTV